MTEQRDGVERQENLAKCYPTRGRKWKISNREFSFFCQDKKAPLPQTL